MDSILMVNRIGRTMITITSHDSIHSFEIAPGPITTSVKKEAYEYEAYPFSYSREALGGRLEVYDCTGRLVYSWQRAYSSMEVQHQSSPVPSQRPSQFLHNDPSSTFEKGRADPPISAQQNRSPIPSSTLLRQISHSNQSSTAERTRTSLYAGAQKQRPSTSSETFSETPHGGPSIKAESAGDYSSRRVQQQRHRITPPAAPQTFHSGTSLNTIRASQDVNTVSKKRKRYTGAEYDTPDGVSASAPRATTRRHANYESESTDSEPIIYKEAATKNNSSPNTNEFNSFDDFSVDEQDTSEDESDSNSESEASDPVAPRKRNAQISRGSSLRHAQPFTKDQKAFIIKQLTTVRKYKQAEPFRFPVDPVSLDIPDYHDKIKHPMDLHTMVLKVREHMYPSLPALVADFDQIVRNSIIYNGEDNDITKSARNMKEIFENSMIDFPAAEPAPVETNPFPTRTRAREAEEIPSLFSKRKVSWRQTRAARAARRQNRSNQDL